MDPIRSLDALALHVRNSGTKRTIAAALAEDPNTIGAVARAAEEGFISAIMIGDKKKIISVAEREAVDPEIFEIIHSTDEAGALKMALDLVHKGRADILMKGLVGTDKFLKAVLDKEKGLLPPHSVMSYVCAIQIPRYRKLLFVTDTAVIPFPDLGQKIAIVKYAVAMARKFGIEKPRVALVSATEKVSDLFPQTLYDAMICRMAERGQIRDCIIDGPLDIFLACDPASLQVKGINTPVGGEADILVFPSIEASNTFYKGLMLFAGGELAGLIQGTVKPVVVMSRSESPVSKYYCIALACLMA